MIDEGDIPALLLGLWQVGIDAVQPARCLPPHLPRDRPAGRQVLFALGKAAPKMAAAAMDEIEFDAGLVIAPHSSAELAGLGGGKRDDAWTFLTASHPEPDEHSLAAGRQALAFVAALRPEDRLVALISGGGSALMVAPRPGLSLADKIEATRKLLASGAPIATINRERAAMSLVKAGGLARACGTRDIWTIVMSDVPGGDPAVVASGPTLQPGSRQAAVCADADTMLCAIAEAARAAGLEVANLGGAIEGDAVALAQEHARIARAAERGGRPLLILSGGETSVIVHHPAERGGRNLTYALALADAVDGVRGIAALAADSDGIDGNSQVAGAMVDGSSAAALRRSGFVPREALAANKSHAALAAIGATLRIGPTGVNVNDCRLILVH